MTTNIFRSGPVATFRAELKCLRAEREARRSLERELASFRTPAEISELLMLIGDQDTAEADVVRDILTDNLASAAQRAA